MAKLQIALKRSIILAAVSSWQPSLFGRQNMYDTGSATRAYVSADVLQLAQQVNGAIAGPAKLEGARQEVVVHPIGQVDLDATDEAQVAAAEVVVDHAENLVLDHLVRLICQRGVRIRRRPDGARMRCDLLLDPIHLPIVGAGCRGAGRPTLAAGFVRTDHRAARRRLTVLTAAEAVAHLPACRDGYMRAEEHDDVAVLRHVA